MSGEQDREALEVLLRRAAREHLGLADGDHWPSGVSTSQADAVLASDWLADLIAQAEQRGQVEALREAARQLRDDDLRSHPDNRGPKTRFAAWLVKRADRIAQAEQRGREEALREIEARIDGDPTLRLGHNVSVVCSCLRCDVVHGALRIVRDVRGEELPHPSETTDG